MSNEDLKQVVHNIMAAWENFDLEAIAALYHQDVLAEMNHQKADYEAILHRMHYCREHYDSIKFHPQDMIVEEDKVALRTYQDVVAKDSNAIERYRIMVVYQIKDGKVKDMWAHIDQPIDYFAEIK